jgi:putative heme-binding domain-containing protein
MRGVLFVLDDDEALPAELPFVVDRKFVRDWKLSDLTDDVDALAERSTESGHRVFHIAGCGQCHAVGGHGATWGPDLTRIHERFSGAKLLQQILEPSSEINPAFQTTVIERRDGSIVTGLVVAEDEHQLAMLPNPLTPDQVTRIPRGEIQERTVSPVSTMPDGLLMTLTRDEILDLLAYLSRP